MTLYSFSKKLLFFNYNFIDRFKVSYENIYFIYTLNYQNLLSKPCPNNGTVDTYIRKYLSYSLIKRSRTQRSRQSSKALINS